MWTVIYCFVSSIYLCFPKVYIKPFIKIQQARETLEKTERQIKIGKSRNTGDIGNTRHSTKTNKTKTQHKKLKVLATRTPPKTGSEHR